MAVNPAAANPNQFANTNLDGGKAEMAMWGGNTNPPLPSTPQNAQPNAASVASAMNSPNSLALSNTTPTSFANPVPQAQQDWVSHNMAMLQQMAAGPQRQAAPAQPTYGVDADNNLQIGDSIIPMGQNPTAAAQALQSPQAQQGTANLRPGFRPVSASDVQASCRTWALTVASCTPWARPASSLSAALLAGAWIWPGALRSGPTCPTRAKP